MNEKGKYDSFMVHHSNVIALNTLRLLRLTTIYRCMRHYVSYLL